MFPLQKYSRLTNAQTNFLTHFFAHCDAAFLDTMMLKSYPKNHVLISTDDTCPYVYILLKGRLQAVEEYASDQPYSFTELEDIEIVGDYELFTKSASRLVTLTTLERSLFLIIPSIDYITWIRSDANALSIRIEMLIRQIVSQTRTDRHSLFLDNRSRFLHFLHNECRHIINTSSDAGTPKTAPVSLQSSMPGHGTSADRIFPIKISYTHEEIANRLGCSLRTVNRTIASLPSENTVTVQRGKMYISREQYQIIQNIAAKL